ncbi:DUF4124 domain-containing protein [Variovorax sp. PCZ-1]|uniref:DUF4124 domain-containing protein n=1 Tax=Variovorax sp. PCZ-1 TaxID=2835533 RepID=UPI001BCE2936|nr:DUF4124 domain-containing protein [Variovorax sp. PCZ-1]MBS7808718.1 DUF4124 domain-containing protein [Variovorax sp. PCZ-1]
MRKFHVKHIFAPTACLMITAWLCLASPAASAQKIYRCAGAGGQITISDTACAHGQGGEISVKPASGAASPPAKADPQTRGAMDKRLAEYEALLSPECRRARQAFEAKARERGGMDELMKEGNPISKAWETCQFAVSDALGKLSAKDREKAEADERRRREQEKVAQQKSECAAKQRVLDERRARLPSLSEADRAALRVVEQDVAANCR